MRRVVERSEAALEQDAEGLAIGGQLVLAGVDSSSPVLSDDAALV